MRQLVIGSLQESGVDGDHRLQAITGKSGCKGQRMLLGNGDIMIALGILL